MPSSDIHDHNIHDHIVVRHQDGPPPKKPKRFQCIRCQRLFGRLEHLQRHERTHTQERPFACHRCQSRFTRSDLLIRHERLSHGKYGQGSRPSDNGTSNSAQGVIRSPGDGASRRGALSSPPPPSAPATQDVAANQSVVGPQVAPPITGEPGSGPVPPVQEPRSTLTSPSLTTGQTAFQDALAVAPSTTAFGLSPGMPTEPFVHNAAQPPRMESPSAGMGASALFPDIAELDEPFDSFVAFLEADTLSSYRFTSMVTTEQPMPFFPFELGETSGLGRDNDPDGLGHGNIGQGQGIPEESNSFSRLGSRLPSLQPDEHGPDLSGPDLSDPLLHGTSQQQQQQQQQQHPETHRLLSEPKRAFLVSHDDRQLMLDSIYEFASVPIHFQLPTRLALVRYIRAYIDGFHEHLPFLHIPSISVKSCAVELTLAMAAVGAQYCFEGNQGVELFHAARAIATERIRKRDTRIASAQRDREQAAATAPSAHSTASATSSPAMAESVGSSPSHSRTVNGPLGLPTDPDASSSSPSFFPPAENLMQSAQALLILMAMATWAKHKEILREALAIQSILASIVRDDGLRSEPAPSSESESGPGPGSESWQDWSRNESTLRTKYIVFCFFNLHCIVYDIPPLILNSEIKLRLPCSAAEFKADTEAKWREARARANEPARFQDALRWLFSGGGSDMTKWHSSLGNYVLIHAIIQHVFFVRQTARCRFDAPDLTPADAAPLEQALRNWQSGWKRNPESSLDPTDPNGPVAFNSTALLRLAYIRLNMDTGPGRALGTRDPLQIANALRDTPVIRRTPKLVRALLHSAHALSVPIKIGIRLVAKTQAFIWSIQHSLCSLECALMLSKWLEAVSQSRPGVDPPVTADERKILSLVKAVLDETEFAIPPDKTLDLPQMARYLNAGVSRVWGTIFRGAQTWDIVDVIGSSLNIYADMLEAA